MQQATAPMNFTSRPFILSVSGLVLASLISIGIGTWMRPAAEPVREVPRISLELRMLTAPEGDVVTVLDNSSGREIDRLVGDQSGFLRTMIRVIRRDLGPIEDVNSIPFRIEAWHDHRVTLEDLASGRRIDLRDFGPTNAEVFIRWLMEKEARG